MDFREGETIMARKIIYVAKKTVTMIRDIKHELGKPVYDQLPPVTYTLPTNPDEMGPDPKAGKLMKLEAKKRQIIIYDDATQNFKTIDFTPIDHKDKVRLRDPLVFDKKFPVVDRVKKAVTVYDKRAMVLTTFSLPEEYFKLPDDTFGFGDEVRIYAKVPGKAQRLMNISETDIFKK
jgi:hypothetical protein